MAINLRIVGIFFKAALNLNGPQAVIDVLKAAQQEAQAGNIPNVSDFSFETSTVPNQAAVSFSATYTGEFQGNRELGYGYQPGEYSLAEDLAATPAYQVWQYYVLDANGAPYQTGIKFLDDPNAVVPDNGTLIWRLVSVLHGVNPRSQLVKARQQG